MIRRIKFTVCQYILKLNKNRIIFKICDYKFIETCQSAFFPQVFVFTFDKSKQYFTESPHESHSAKSQNPKPEFSENAILENSENCLMRVVLRKKNYNRKISRPGILETFACLRSQNALINNGHIHLLSFECLFLNYYKQNLL